MLRLRFGEYGRGRFVDEPSVDLRSKATTQASVVQKSSSHRRVMSKSSRAREAALRGLLTCREHSEHKWFRSARYRLCPRRLTGIIMLGLVLWGCLWITMPRERQKLAERNALLSLDGKESPKETTENFLEQARTRKRTNVGDEHAQEAQLLPQLVIFTTMRPDAQVSEISRQAQAIASWMDLEPTPKIVFQGCDPGLEQLAHHWNATVDCNIDVNFRGVPLFNAMVHRAFALQPRLALRGLGASARLVVGLLVNADVHLPRNLPQIFAKLLALSPEFFAVAARWDVDVLHPGNSREAFAQEHGTLHSYGGIDLFAWSLRSYQDLLDSDASSSGNRSVIGVRIPSFVFGRGKYDNWLFHEILQTRRWNLTVDITEAATLVHVRHAYPHLQVEDASTSGNFWTNNKRHSWEAFLNVHLALAYGSYESQLGTPLHAPFKLVPCLEHEYCVIQRRFPARCLCEYSNTAPRTQTDPVLRENKWWQCGSRSLEEAGDYRLPLQGKLAHQLDALLKEVVDPMTNLVIMTAATYEYRFLLMNFVCNLRRLRIHKLLVAALDEDLYRYAYARGLAVYLEPALIDSQYRHSLQCAFGSACFRHRSKLKSRHVYEILRRGHDVLWSDVDITWFRDVRPELLRARDAAPPNISGRSVWFQSNEPDPDQAWNGIRRLNSGFYYAVSSASTVTGLSRILEHAASSQLSEQPSFYDVLCGEQGEYRLDNKTCFNGDLYTHFLDPRVFRNGANWTYWVQNRADEGAPAAAILHNNWIKGLAAKQERLEAAGLAYFDPELEICRYDDA